MLYAHFTTSEGNFSIQLFDDLAPKTVANFTGLAEGTTEWTDPRTGKKSTAPYYNGTIFHRVIDGFMIQGGGFDKDFHQKETRAPIANEAQAGVRAGLQNGTGTIAMARTADPNSATAQFFINVADNSFLDAGNPRGDGNGYAVFGKVVSGMDVVNKIAKLPTTAGGPFPRDVPKQAVVIESASVVEQK
jgi:cyclophilin family peptidyl-prolyl cis-trans isomerase